MTKKIDQKNQFFMITDFRYVAPSGKEPGSLVKKLGILTNHGINKGSQEIANFVLLQTCSASVLADILIYVDSCYGILSKLITKFDRKKSKFYHLCQISLAHHLKYEAYCKYLQNCLEHETTAK